MSKAKVKLTNEQIAFLRLVKKTIRDEIQSQLNEVVEHVAQKLLSEIQAPDSSPRSESPVTSLSDMAAAPPPQKRTTSWNSGNPILDSVMQETTVDPRGSFGFSDKYGSMMNPVQPSMGGSHDVGVNPNTPGVDDVLKEVLTRDYSELMKAIKKDQKRKGIK